MIQIHLVQSRKNHEASPGLSDDVVCYAAGKTRNVQPPASVVCYAIFSSLCTEKAGGEKTHVDIFQWYIINEQNNSKK